VTDARRHRARVAEDAAATYLARQGMAVIERNVRFREGEIDLVARDGPTLVFVEVKSRRLGWDEPAAAVTSNKRARLARLARHYLKHRGLGQPPCRYDVLAVGLDGDRVALIRHLRGAFDGDAW
jgi:putative endonuclease